MVVILILILIAIPVIHGALKAGTPSESQVHTQINDSIDPSMEIQHFSNIGYRLCFDQNILFKRPDLLKHLPRSTKVGISDCISQTLLQLGKSSQYAFLTKSILNNLQEFEDVKICKTESNPSLFHSSSLSDLRDIAIFESYLTDQSENLYYNLLITDSKNLWSNANNYGLKSILITDN